jgi:hypothetical protein
MLSIPGVLGIKIKSRSRTLKGNGITMVKPPETREGYG